jgi:predicted nucleic acid-binding protein
LLKEEKRVFGIGGKMVVRVFIDTNIFTGYLILSGIEERKPESERKDLWKRYKKIKPCYDFIKKVLENKNKKIHFITSGLVFSEIFHSLYEEAVCKKMMDDGVPLSSWIRLKNKFSLFIENYEIKELEDAVDNLFHSEKIKPISEAYHLKLISRLILKHQFMTQDSILISTATHNKCKFFVTRDEELIRNWRNIGRKSIKALSPEDAIKEFFPEK